ncbi:hypothetical protein [Arthrobacter sp. NPDC093139]|uniref:hypothetical protein n=1 Tax=Arthrobacter sp. NPDC093139 TaxID=3363945 RepID=UPI003819F0AD
MSDATTAHPEEHAPKEAAIQARQAAASFRLWARGDFKVRFSEAAPGVSKAVRPNDETCKIQSGSGTIWPMTRLDPAAVSETRAGRTLYEGTARQSSDRSDDDQSKPWQ